MHEVSIMEEAVRLAVDAAKDSGAGRITGMRLRVGALSGVVPDALRFAFDVVCRGTVAEGATLEIEPVAATSWCPVCRTDFAGADFYNECPRCHKVSGDLQSGREIEIATVETT
jgi:hydrogenase nickel incorporation protein HypA/HybF